MKKDKVYVFRKTLLIVTLLLLFISTGFLVVSTQVKTVKFSYFDNTKTIKTLSSTVQDFLTSNNIVIDDSMVITPSLESSITKNTNIVISSKEEKKINIVELISEYNIITAKIVEEVSDIPFSEETIDNPTINRGVTRVSTEGVNGEKVTKYLVKYSSQAEISKTELYSEVKAEATNKVIEVGTKINTTVARSADVIIPKVDGNFKQYNIKLPLDQQQYAYSMAQTYGIDYTLLLAIMYKESGYNPNAIGGGNSYGLCQIHVSNHNNLRNKLGISNFLDPYDNIKAGAYMLSIYVSSGIKASSDSNTQLVYALNSYNMGEGNYYANCYSKGIINREYSTSVINLRNRLISNGGL